MSASRWSLRSCLNDSKKPGVDVKPTTLLAFTPDIVPLDQVKAEPTDLVRSYRHFVAHTIDRTEQSTLVYIRAKTDSKFSEPTKVDLYTIENHLVLWPHITGKALHVGSTNLKVVSHSSKRIVGCGNPIRYSPITLQNSQHQHETLIASFNGQANVSSQASASVKNWRDLINIRGNDDTLAFYNVMMADPCASHVKLITRLDVLENESDSVDLHIGIQAVGIPTDDIEASLQIISATSPAASIIKQHLSPSKELGAYVTLPANFSGQVILEIFNKEEHVFADYSSVSIVLHAVNSKYPNYGKEVLIGAEHVVFDSNPRVKHLVSKLESSSNAGLGVGNQSLTAAIKDANVESPRATVLLAQGSNDKGTNNSKDSTSGNFYFRTRLSETAASNRDGSAYISPDIQPSGTSAFSDPTKTLSDFSVDKSSKDQIGVSPNHTNYVYVRAHTTKPHKGQIRLFLVPNTTLLHPSDYSKTDYTVFDIDPDDKTSLITAFRKYDTSSSSGEKAVIFKDPFILTDLKAPPSGSDHYCFVTECKPHRTQKEIDDGVPPYEWPHAQTSNFKTGSEFAAWIQSERRVAQRNASFVTKPDGDSYSKRTSFKIPKGFNENDKWHYMIKAENCPIGSEFSMNSSEASIKVEKTKVTSKDQGVYVEFTGKKAGYSCQIILHWYANGKTPNGDQNLNGTLSLYKYGTSNVAKSKTSEKQSNFVSAKANIQPAGKLHVGDSYPQPAALSSLQKTNGRSAIGGAIKARVSVTKTKRSAMMLKASSGSGSGSDNESGSDDSGSEGVWYDTEIGRDSMYFKVS